MSGMGPRAFLDLLRQSGLVEEAELKKSLAALAAARKGNGAGSSAVNLETLTAHLVGTGLLTGWQREKLEEGKTKGFFLGGYRLLSMLGVGGMSAVYLAEHRLGRHRRAIKVLPRERVADKSYLDRFYQEGKAAAALNHPNIVRIFDLASEGDTHFMVMEFVEGTDLQELVRRDGPLDVDRALDCILQAATGLRHAHERKIVHRDIKPSNLLAGPDGVVKVLDLGLALMADAAESLTLVHNDRVMGTADYLAPEQALNSHEVDQRADIYGLGCTLYFLLTGRPPFPDGSIAQRIAAHQSRPAPMVSHSRAGCPAEIDQLCSVMMQKRPEDRFQSCRELIAEIKRIRSGSGTAPAPQPASQSATGAGASGTAQAGDWKEPVRVESGGPTDPSSGSSGRSERAVRPRNDGAAPPDNRPGAAARTLAAANAAASELPSGQPARDNGSGLRPRIEADASVGRIRIADSDRRSGSIQIPDGVTFGVTSVPRVSHKPRQAAPGWVIGGIIGGMFVILLVVLVVALRMIH